MMFTAGSEEQAVADTSRAAAQSGGAGGEIFGELLKHVRDSHELDTPFGEIPLPHFHAVTIAGIPVDFSITKHVLFVWLAAVILAAVAIAAARKNNKRPVPTGIGNLVE